MAKCFCPKDFTCDFFQISYGKTYVKICFKQPLFVQYTAVSSKIEN